MGVIATAFLDLARDVKAMRHSEYMLSGGRGSTKSSFISLKIVEGLYTDNEANAIIYRRVGNTLKDSVYAQMVWAIDMLKRTGDFIFRKSPMEIIRIETGQKIMFRGADNPMKSKSIKLVKGYFKFLWFEELTEFRSMEDIRTIKQSIFRGGNKAITFYSYNPPKTSANWVNAEALTPREDRLVHTSTYLDIIYEHRDWLGEPFIAEAEAIKATNERAYRNEYLGEVTGTGGLVFDNVEVRPITDDELKTLDRFYNGLDFGFAVDPDAATRWGYDRKTRKLYAVAEYYGAHTSIDTLAEKVRKIAGQEIVRCDSADPRMIDELRRRGINAIGVKKGPGSREHGYRWLQDQGGIVIDPQRTPNIAREFQAYEFAQDRMGNFIPEFPDGNDHCLTGDTIVHTTAGERRIDELVGQTGMAICYDEENERATTARFFNVRQTGVEEIYEIELDDGRVVRASGEHLLLTARGWIMAREIAENDEILEVSIVMPTDGAPHYVRVKSVRRRMAEPVYNMEVERHHNFAVNGGLIVHNCLDSTRYACEPEIGRKIATTRSDIY